MDTARKIMIGIFANPRRTDGAFAKTDGLPFEMSYEVPSGVSANIFSYSFRRTEQYTLFMMYCSSDNIKTLDGKEGILNIGVSISRGFTLSGGKSVYDLLMAVFDKLKKNYMSESKEVNGREMFSFNRTMEQLPQSYFDDVLADYPVMESRSGHTPMKGSSSAGIELSEERIRALFGNADYYINRHFLGYSEVIVAPKLNNYFSGVRIPMPKRTVTLVPADSSSKIIAYYYENNDKRYLSDAAGSSEVIVEEQDFDRNIIVTSNRNDRCYERDRVSFTVNNVLSRSGRDFQLEGVVYDPVGEKIVCTLKDKPKIETVAIDLQTPESPADLRNSIRLTLDGQNLSVNDEGKFALSGIQIDAARQPGHLKVSCNHTRYDIDGNPFLSDGFYHVSLKHKTSDIEQRKSFVPESKGVKAELRLKLQVSGVNKFNWGKVVVTASCEKQSVGKTVSELPDNRIVDLSLLPDFFGPDKQITISVSDGSVRWEKTCDANYIKNCICQDRCVKVSASEVKSIGTKRSEGGEILGKIIFWSAPIFLILWIATGVFAFLQWKEKGKLKDQYESAIQYYTGELQGKTMSVEETKIQETTVPAVTVKTLTDKQKRTFDNALSELKKEKLTFETVNILYKTYSELDDELKSQVDETYRQEVDKIKAYHNVVDILQKGNADDIKKLDVDNENMKLLNEYHRNMVLGIYYGDYRDKSLLYALDSMESNGVIRYGSEDGLIKYIDNRADYDDFNDLESLLKDRNTQQPEK